MRERGQNIFYLNRDRALNRLVGGEKPTALKGGG